MSGEGHHIDYVPEPAGVRLRPIGWTAVGTLLLLAISIAGLHAIYRAVVSPTPPPPVQDFPQPRVDTQERTELQRLRAAQSAKLERWRWSDHQHTLVQVPIERAMQLLEAKGGAAYDPLLPPQPALAAPDAAAERATMPDQATPAADSQPSPEAKP